MTYQEEAKVASDVPLFQQANEKLDELYNRLINRINTIDGELERLSEEAASLRGALSRIVPPVPTPPGADPRQGLVGGVERLGVGTAGVYGYRTR